MSVRSQPIGATEAAPFRYNVLHAGAIIAHALSYLTTLWFVQWLGPALELRAAGVVAYVLEMFLFALKQALRSRRSRSVGWAGVGADALINMGGLVPYAPGILSFPPMAAVLAGVGALSSWAGLPLAWMGVPFTTLPYGDAVVALSLSGLLVSLGGGMLLSAGPGQLWDAAERG